MGSVAIPGEHGDGVTTADDGGRCRVVAVVVTWNRCHQLVEALTALRAQTRPPDAVVVVDNSSDDGSPGAVRSGFPEADLVALATNLGGAGGFAAGVARAMGAHAPDLLWLMDDDTVPEPEALASLLRVRSGYRGPRPALLASRVVWTDGRDHPMNTPRRKPGLGAAEARRAARVGGVAIRSASFVSCLVDAEVVAERGLPVADYFLWNDDFEYTTRLLRGNVGLLCPESVVVHKTHSFGSTNVDPGQRFFYEVRNKVWLFTRSPGLNPVERLVYLGSTLRRWAATVHASSDRATLVRALGKGLVAGARRGPRDNAALIAAALSGAGRRRGG